MVNGCLNQMASFLTLQEVPTGRGLCDVLISSSPLGQIPRVAHLSADSWAPPQTY
uniref:Uncharacterized protein n=1 Tax=Saimiri boliviensis boliviensis TaxID=39432 RepID=A0A2K6TFG9_SAIBB